MPSLSSCGVVPISSKEYVLASTNFPLQSAILFFSLPFKRIQALSRLPSLYATDITFVSIALLHFISFHSAAFRSLAINTVDAACSHNCHYSETSQFSYFLDFLSRCSLIAASSVLFARPVVNRARIARRSDSLLLSKLKRNENLTHYG